MNSLSAIRATASDLNSDTRFFADLKEGLSQLNAMAGNELLRVAEQLQVISRQVREINSSSREMSELAAGAECRSAIATLRQMLSDAQSLQDSVQARRSRLAEVMQQLRKLGIPLSKTQQLPVLLSTVAMLIRIETSRLAGAAGSLALLPNEINDLAKEISSYVNEMLAKSDRTRMSLEALLFGTQKLQREKEDDVTELVERTNKLLDALLMRVDKSSAAARSIDERYTQVRGAIEKVVMSLQVQDIARQRIEHVQEAMEQLENRPTASRSAHGVLLLQRSQVQATGELLRQSIDTIVTSLGAVSNTIGELASDTEKLATSTAQDSGTFASTIEEGCAAVWPIYAGYSESSSSLLAASETVLSSANEISGQLRRLEEIRGSIRFAALNATIETHRLGTTGGALKALGSEVQEIADKSGEDMSSLLEILTAVGKIIRTEPEASSGSADNSLIPLTREHLGELSTSVPRSHQQISERLETLLSQVTELKKSLQIKDVLVEKQLLFAKAFETTIAKFDAPLRQFEQAPAAYGDQDDAGLAALYSMESERSIHEQHFGIAGKAFQANPAEGSDLQADGIELF